MKIGSKVYWRKSSGEVILITPEIESEYARETTKEDDMGFYPQLKGFDPAQVDVLQLTYRQYYEDFQRAKSYIVNPDTGKMEFIYIDDNGGETPTPQVPLTDQLSELKARQASTEAALLTFMDATTHA
ncbi:hypothetical protein J2W97_000882 [Paenibacillus jamilae]|uniref:hypothetical protein n=1 Tax=Paenibacillus polymyxa TaxID=1406 RepID=UPI0015805D50|nr:hypothetical protein [Paenibacillus polymyxa]MDP9674899.1 hypothetical protein [Paenibacillus jamilae]MBY0023739.1 hypothetical protein [Paenibacillus polymyxa]MBY0056411.1 hypothetical protein [Paenibacillus polymyxa]MBY0071758.1 hypothetical protein [Paenibacillus polymyxa]MBY0080676.1 hypothetical protein [Paenibacillus polymyxa]